MNAVLRQYIGGAFIVGYLMLALGACKKTFNTEPPTSLVPEDLSAISTDQVILNGIYRLLRTDYDTDQFGIPSLMIMNDLMGEDMGVSQDNWFTDDYQYLSIRSLQYRRPAYLWSYFYRIADNANQVLGRVNVQAPQKGQALALRAFAYFNLVNYFTQKPYKEAQDNKAIPLYLSSTRTPQPRAPVKDIYAQIVQDLESAIPLLADFSAPRKSVINQAVAYGLLARTYLFMEEWQKAADAADKALSGGKGSHSFDGSDLMSRTEFQSGFNSVANSECMWGLPTNSAQTGVYASFFSHMDPFVGGYAGAVSVFKFMSQVLYDTMHPADVRKSVIARPLDKKNLNVITGDLVQMKFRDPAVSFAVAHTYDTASTIYARRGLQGSVRNAWLGENVIMRKAEMYLIYAEACCRSDGDKTKACKALKALRIKRGVPDCSNNLTIDTVYLERRKELFGEGFRFFDLKRLKLPADRTKGGHLPLILSRAIYIRANSDSMRVPIPQGEINNNPFISETGN